MLIQEIDYGTPASKSKKTVTLTVDGVPVTVPEGTSIMRSSPYKRMTLRVPCSTDEQRLHVRKCSSIADRNAGSTSPSR